MKNKIFSELIILLALVLCLAACDGAVHLPGQVKISLDVESASIGVGETKQLTATITPESAADTPIVWESSNTDIATVDNKGLVTGKATGEVTITAKAGNATAICLINVKYIPVTGIALNTTGTSIDVGSSEQLIATVSPTNATNKSVIWESNNAKVLVSSDGLVTVLNDATGPVTITARTVDGGFTDSCDVTIVHPI